MVFQERTYSVLLVSAAEKFNSSMLSLLPPSDYWPIHTAGSVSEARQALQEDFFDVVIVNSPLPDDQGIELAMHVCAGSSSGVLLLVRIEIYEEVCARVTGDGVFTLPKPTNMQALSQGLRMLCATRERLRRMEVKQLGVEKKIEELSLVNRAKWLLIECLSMTEEGAQHYIERQAMDLRISKRESAENVIKTYGK